MTRKLTQSQVTAWRIPLSGAWELSALVGGYRVSRVYYGYTKRAAIRWFVAGVNKGEII